MTQPQNREARTFFVPGTPAPQGSKRYVGQHGGRAVLVESSKKVKPWRHTVSQVANMFYTNPIDGPVYIGIQFIMPRPKSLPKRITHMVKKPDLDKLIRSTLDALSGIAFTDDNRVTRITATKQYAKPTDPTGAQITITPAA